MAQTVKNVPVNARDTGDSGSIPELETSPEKETATHFSVLAWRILWKEEPGGLLITGSQRVGHD